MKTSKETVLKVENLSYTAGGSSILKDISFQINRGEIVGLIGPNGAGKTTLVRILIGDITHYSGSFEVKGMIGYLPQYRTIDRTFPITAYEVARMGLYRYEKRASSFRKKKNIRKKVFHALESCGIGHLASHKIGFLSGGEYQRLLLARALLMDPDLLILDEPEAGVDEMGKSTFFDLLENVQSSKKPVVLMISHDIGLVFKACERIMCLNRTLHCSKPSVEMSVSDLQSVFSNMDILIPSNDHYQEKHTQK